MITPPIPDDWSPAEALTVFEFIDNLRDHIWARYGLRIQEFEAADRVTDADASPLDLFDTNAPLPF
jgi:hypothetical protein